MDIFMELFGTRCEECHELTMWKSLEGKWKSLEDKVLCAKCDGERVGRELAEEFGRELRKARIMER